MNRLLTLFPYVCIMSNRLLGIKAIGEKLGLDPGQAKRLWRRGEIGGKKSAVPGPFRV
jgi:hypothetical protein